MQVSENPNIRMIQGDCMKAMADMEENAYELAIVDPEYGLNIAKNGTLNVHSNSDYKASEWDKERPTESYFNQLKRVSERQLICGGNYFPELWNNDCRGLICWNKLNHHDNRAPVEYIWYSEDSLPKYFEYMWDGNRYGFPGNIRGVGERTIRIHPTEKPVALYRWLLTNYATEGDHILDTHGGSGSIAIACYDMGFDLDWYEIDKDHYNDAVERFKEHKKQGQLFSPEEQYQKPKQLKLEEQ